MAVNDNSSDGHVPSVAVVGGGVSGLVASYKLKSKGIKVTLFEADERAGGRIRSNSQHGFIWDEGANTMTENEEGVGNLISNLGLREKQQFPISQNKRYITKNGVPELIPSDPISLIKSNFISTKAKLRVMFEPIMWTRFTAKSYGEYSVESVGQFFERHFGKEVVDLLIDPFVAGTSGGDPNSLSMRHSFPEIWNLEKKYGSIIVGAMKSKFSERKNKNMMNGTTSEKKKQHLSFSFQGGMQTLTDALCSKIGNGNMKLSSKVFSLACSHDETSQFHKWSIFYNSCQANQKEYPLNQTFDAVIMTAPLCNVQEMKFEKEGSPLNLNFLPKVIYVPMSVLITSFKKKNVERPLEGFGVLVPSQEKEFGLKTLGTLFSSMMFPDRAPNDQYLYTTFVGGSRNKDLAGASFEELKQVVVAELQKLLGVNGQPTFVKHIYWKNAFPLYSHDYDSVIEGIKKLEDSLPGLFYAGNQRDGLAVGKAITSGCKAADRVLSYLNASVKQI